MPAATRPFFGFLPQQLLESALALRPAGAPVKRGKGRAARQAWRAIPEFICASFEFICLQIPGHFRIQPDAPSGNSRKLRRRGRIGRVAIINACRNAAWGIGILGMGFQNANSLRPGLGVVASASVPRRNTRKPSHRRISSASESHPCQWPPPWTPWLCQTESDNRQSRSTLSGG